MSTLIAAAHEIVPFKMDDNLSIINPCPTFLEGPSLLHELIAGPETEGTALHYTDAEGRATSLSYRELHARAAKLASRLLQNRRRTPEAQPEIIPLFVPQSPSLYISLLAILKANAAFCPLNLDVPEERLRFILKDTSAQILLTTSQLRPKLPPLEDVSIIVVDEEDIAANPADLNDTFKSHNGLPEPHLAYIMYTSGSTGLPKAVCLSHRAATQSLLAHDRHIPEFSRFLQFASPTFDVSVFEIFFPLIRGATLVSCARERLLSDLPGTITALNVDAAELTPSVAASLVRKRENVPTLRLLLTIGEMLNVQVIKEFGGSQEQQSILWGMYGPTEAAIHCTLQPSFDSEMPAGNIGIPLDTVSCFVMKPAESPEDSSNLEVLPLGEVGELVVGGYQLADGYLNREEQTRAAFVTHPTYGSLYRTGDKARLLPSGLLECQGRISSGQVKLRGQRIELGEIEHAASKLQGCHAVVASVISGQLVVFCIADKRAVTINDVKDACRKWLPNYMVPSDVVLLEDFPYLPSGKVDKRKLESDYLSNLNEVVTADSNITESMQKLLNILHGVLQVHLDSTTDLSAAGLDSLKAISVASELRRNGYHDIGALDLLNARTVRDLEKSTQRDDSPPIDENLRLQKEKLLREIAQGVTEDLETEYQERDIEEILPCTPLQDAMLSETARNPQAYCNSFELSLPAKFDLQRIRDCFETLAEKHAMLRSGFCVSRISISSYAQVTFKQLDPSQIRMDNSFTRDFSISEPSMLLKPLQIQLRRVGDQVEVLVQLHHALYDQWSVDILMEDMDMILCRADTPIRPSFRSLNDHFLTVRMTAGSQAPSLEFWQTYLASAPICHLPNLTGKHLEPAPLRVANRVMDIDASALHAASQKRVCSPHVFFQAAYAYLLSIYRGEPDIVFGTVFSGRTLPIGEIENIFGPILSTLPSRVDISGARTFDDLLHQMQGDNREIMRHSTASLADIKRACAVSPGQALFDSIFVWQETARNPQSYSNHVRLVNTTDYLEFNLTLELEPSKHGIRAKATYQPSTMPADHVNVLLQQLEEITKQVIEKPDMLIDDLGSCLSPSSLSVFNPEPRYYNYTQGLGSLVEKHAVASPEQPAICFATNIDDKGTQVETVTYEELNSRANMVAHHLISIGTKPDELVCICMEKSIDLYTCILGIVKAGAGYLPLVPETPPARIQQILADAGVKICITNDAVSQVIDDMNICQIVNPTTTDFSVFPHSNPIVPFEPTNLAYAVFTSGTTGRPKGVLVTQENMLSNLEVLAKIYPTSAESRFLQACNVAFDVSVFEIFFTWSAGICLCSAVKDVLFRDIEHAINMLDVTHLSLTPTVAALVNPVNVPKVNFLVTAGEEVTQQVFKAWVKRGLHVGYGPSETTNICTLNYEFDPQNTTKNLGYAFENTSAFVIANDARFQLLPAGALGELCFGGQQVFRGYQNMPERTAERTLLHPEFGRVYRSGDMGRMLPDGRIIIQGRIDDQRKIRGQRIELGEISGSLLQSPYVKDCSIQIVGDTKEKERLVAFWVPEHNPASSYMVLHPDQEMSNVIQTLFDGLSDQLPIYMVPTLLVPVAAFPRTNQGKIDRRKLADDLAQLNAVETNKFSQARDESSDTTNMSDNERALSEALSEVLRVPQENIMLRTSFFALGLDSVSAIRFAKNVKTKLGIQVDVSKIMKNSNISRLAAILYDSTPSSKSTSKVPNGTRVETCISKALKVEISNRFESQNKEVQAILPCTPLQEAMLSAGSDGTASAYLNQTLFRISGDLDRIKHCWQTMLERHGILRTAFASTDDAQFPYVQVVLKDVELPWDDVEKLPNNEGDILTSTEFQPPYRLRAYRVDKESYLSLEMHHAMYDANAMSSLLHELESVYRNAILPPPASFSAFLDYMLSQDQAAAETFYKTLLDQYVPKPFTPCKDPQTGFGMASMQLPLSQSVVEEFLRKHSISLLALIQAAWAKVLATSQGSADVCFGNVVSGRSVPVEGVEALVAPCFNTVPIRVDLAKSQSNIKLAKALAQTNIDILPYQLTPLRRIQAHSSVNGHRLFDSLVLLQQHSMTIDEQIWRLESESGDMDFPCIIEVSPARDAFSLSLHYDRSYFSSNDAPNALCTAFVAAFTSCVRYPAGDAHDIVDYNRQDIAGLLKPDDDILRAATAALRAQTELENPSTPTEETWSSVELEIRDAFAAISNTPADQISRDTTIYRLGLDSISAIQVASRLRKQGLALTAGDILESPSCSQLGSIVQSQVTTPVESTASFDLEAFDERHRPLITTKISSAGKRVAAVRPCTPFQDGIISQSIHSHGQQYINHAFYRVDLDIDAIKLESAWSQVREKHEMLRTGFVTTEDRIHPFAMVTYKAIEADSVRLIHTVSEETPTALTRRQQAALDAIRHDLSIPPWRWDLFNHGDGKCLQFSAHHALYDAETLRMMLGDLHQALQGEALSARPPIDGALSHILESSLNGKESQQDFWLQRLQNVSVTRFPTLSPVRAAEQAATVIESKCHIPRSELEAQCKALGVSMQAAAQAAWARLLAAYIGEPHITFGVVLSGRTAPETASSAFPCITTLPVVANTSRSDNELLQDLTSYNAAVQKHQFTPLSEVQRYAGFPGEALFDSLFAYQRPLDEETTYPQWETVHEEASVDYPISVEIEPLPNDRLGFRLTILPAQIPVAHGRIILDQLEMLMSQILGMQPPEKSKVLSITPAKDPELPAEVQYLHHLATSSIAKNADRIALEFVTNIDAGHVTSRTWTYRELDQESNRVAHLLIANGAKANDVVATSFDKCPEASFAFLGILKAGCAFCAIDPTAPTARKTFIAQDSNARMILTMGNIVSELRDVVACKVIDLVEGSGWESLPTTPIAVPEISPSSVSYVLYTSGTTGTPKGCELTHDNAVQALYAFHRLFENRWNENSRWLQFASYHFDVSVLEQFWTWSAGIRLVCAPRDLILEDLTGFIDTMQITHLDLTPSLGRLLDPQLIPSLHGGVFITGGEALKQDMIDNWGDIGCLFNFYGPTECTIGVTTFPSVPRCGKPSNIGWQFDNVGTYVLTVDGQEPVLRGAIGELCISGRLVGKGYLNRPELTADRFPYLENLGERVYRTGDLVRLLHDNSIEFLGRRDNQVKLRGQRLEIDEIEAVMRQCPGIPDVVCLVAKHPKQQKDLLVAFIAASSQRKQGHVELCSDSSIKTQIGAARAACEEKLPGYMVPTHFIPVDKIPLSVNNKIEEKQLRALYSSMSTANIQEYATESQDQQALAGSERIIATTLAALLDIDTATIKPSSNVFALGLSSISAIQFSRRLKSEGFQTSQVATVLKNPTIQKLAKALGSDTSKDDGVIASAKQSMAACQQRNAGLVTRVLGANGDCIEAVVPCTPLQQGILSRSRSSDSHLYFNSFRYDVQHLDLAKLREVFQLAVDEVQILRAAFVETDDGYVQVFRKEMALMWQDIETSSREAVDELLNEQKLKWANGNMPNLANPLQVVLVHTPDDVIMQIHIHHALYDGHAYQRLIENLSRLYRGQEHDFGEPFTKVLPYGPLRSCDGAREFWTGHLAGIGWVSMPALAEPEARDTLYSVVFDNLAEAHSVGRSLKVTLQAVVQAAWTTTLRRYYQGAIGTVVSGRSIDFDGAEMVIGPLFNTIPFNPALRGEMTWQTLVQDCHEFNVSALPFQHTPLRDIMKWCSRNPSEPLFDTLFVFQGQDQPTEEKVLLVEQETSQFEADYPLSFEVEEMSHGGLRVTVAAKGSICSPSRAAQLAFEFSQAMSAMIASPELSISKSLDWTFPLPTTGPQDGQVAPHLNGVHHFDWSAQALMLRKEIAALACVNEVDVDEHITIFELGLDSVDAVKLSSRLKKKGVNAPVSMLMRSQTIPRILQALSTCTPAASSNASRTKISELEKQLTAYARDRLPDLGMVERVLPASPMQEALVSEMVKASYQAYFNHDVLRIADGVDVSRLERAWETVIDASPILRTGFLEVDDPAMDVTYAQVIGMSNSFRFGVAQLDGDDFSGLLQKVQTMAATGKLTSPQLHLNLVHTPAAQYLVLSIAHALYDGYSLGLLHRDVHDAYHSQFEARPFYSEVLEQQLYAADDESTAFWRGLLSGATRTHMPLRSSTPPSEPVTHRREKESSMSPDDISSFCKKHGITVQALCQTSWAFVLAWYTQSLDVMYGVVLAGRDGQLAEEVIFPTMNTVVMRSVLHGSRREMLQYMQSNMTDVTQHQHSPLRKIQAACQQQVKARSRSSDGSDAFFGTLFTYQKRPDSVNLKSDALYHSVTGASDVEYPVAVEAEMVDGKVVWRTACKSEVLTAEETEEMLARIDSALREIVMHPEMSSLQFKDHSIGICNLPLFERTDVVDESSTQLTNSSTSELENDTTWSPIESTVRQIIAQVTKTPENEIVKNTAFQNLGVDSINAIKISSLLRKESIRISVSEIVKAGSIRSVAAILAVERPQANGVSSETTIDKFCSEKGLTAEKFGYHNEDVEELLPATAGQVYMLSSWQVTEGQVFYPEFVYVLKGDCTIETVRNAWTSVVSRHSVLRTVFSATQDKEVPFVQLVLRNAINSFIDLEQENGHTSAGNRQPFAMLSASKTSDGFRLGLKIHHALYDAVSLPLLIKDLEDHLRARPTSPPSHSLREYVASTIGTEVSRKRRNFWEQYMQGLEIQKVNETALPSTAGRFESFDPSVIAINEQSEAVLRKKGVSLQSLFFAAHAKAYASLIKDNDKDVIIGIYLANRSHDEDFSSLTGPTINLVPLRITSPKQTDLASMAKQIQTDLQHIGTLENSAVGLWELEEWTGVKVDTFVNFIKLPEQGEAELPEQANLSIIEADGGRKTEKRSLVHEVCAEGFNPPQELCHEVVRKAYPRSFDIEATVANGALGIGVFGWDDMFELKRAEEVVQEITDSLQLALRA